MEKYKDHWEKGVYKCAKCGHNLFSSKDKFDSGTRLQAPGIEAVRRG